MLIISASLCVCLTSCATAELVQPVLNGMIYDADNEPVADAQIHITGQSQTVSDIYGHFRIENLRTGSEYVITCSKAGYESTTMKFTYTSISEVAYIRMCSAEQLLDLAEAEILKKRYDTAMSYLDRTDKADGSKVSSSYLRAVIAYQQKQYADALGHLQQLMNDGCREPVVYLFTADVYEYGLADKENAKKYLKLYLASSYDPDAAARLADL